MWRKTVLFFSVVIISLLGLGFWFASMLPDPEHIQQLALTEPGDIDYLQQGVPQTRGKILAVVTSTAVIGTSEKKTGYELTELARAYYVFSANGFEVDIASPQGGQPPVVIDGDDMGAFDYAFLNDEVAQSKVNNSLPLSTIQAQDYQAVYFVGGKGAMFDFPNNTYVKDIIRDLYQSGAVIGAVCHGPAALLNVRLDNGKNLIADKTISSFTNEEELFLIPDAREIFPFLLEDEIVSQGATFSAAEPYLEKVSVDGRLVTGQNPWSVWKLAEAMITQLGYPLQPRKITAEENSVEILSVYEKAGFKLARSHMQTLLDEPGASVDKLLIAMHSIVALMDWEFIKIVDLLRLLKHASNGDARVSADRLFTGDYRFPIADLSSKQTSKPGDMAAVRKYLAVQVTLRQVHVIV